MIFSFIFFYLVISGFVKGVRLTFLCVLWISAFLTVWCVKRLFLQLRLIMYAWYPLPSPSPHLLTLPSCLKLFCQLCILGIGERRTPGRFTMCQFGKPKGKVPERTEERIQESWERRNGWAQKPAQSTGTQKVLLKSFPARVSVWVAL